MFRLSTKTDYGLILLSSFAKASEDKSNFYIPVSSIAHKNKISPKFLSQIAQELKKAGYITSKEGARGGYRLAKPAQDIKILDVLKTLDGEIVRGECFEDDHECHCGGKEMFAQMKKEIEATMAKKTVADLVS